MTVFTQIFRLVKISNFGPKKDFHKQITKLKNNLQLNLTTHSVTQHRLKASVKLKQTKITSKSL